MIIAACLLSCGLLLVACNGSADKGAAKEGAEQTAAPTESGHEGHDHSGHDHSGHDHHGHNHAGHDHYGHDHSGHNHGTATAHSHSGQGKAYESAYVCPMHCKDSGSDKPGTCPACKMDYVAIAEHVGDGHKHE